MEQPINDYLEALQGPQESREWSTDRKIFINI